MGQCDSPFACQPASCSTKVVSPETEGGVEGTSCLPTAPTVGFPDAAGVGMTVPVTVTAQNSTALRQAAHLIGVQCYHEPQEWLSGLG